MAKHLNDPNKVFIGPYTPMEPAENLLRVAIKDNIDVAGYPSTIGSQLAEFQKMKLVDSEVVALIRKLPDSEILGKVNLDEFANGSTGKNAWYGDLVNPLDPDRMVGGSSSGSAVSVAEGLVDVSLGTDTGGSVRIPAAWTGLYGLRPTINAVSTRGVQPLAQSLDTVGPLARGLDVLTRIVGHLLGGQGKPVLRNRLDGEKLRVGRLRFAQAETDVDVHLDDFLMRSAVEVESVGLDGWDEAFEMTYRLIAYEAWRNYQTVVEENADLIGANSLVIFNDGASLTSHDYSDALYFQRVWGARVEEALENFDVLTCPTVADVPPLISEANDVNWLEYSRTMQFSLSGHPALSMPIYGSGMAIAGSAQVIGRYGQDMKVLAVAEALEGAQARGR